MWYDVITKIKENMDSIQLSLGLAVPPELGSITSDRAKNFAYEVYEAILDKLYPESEEDEVVRVVSTDKTVEEILNYIMVILKEELPELHLAALLYWIGVYMALDGFADFPEDVNNDLNFA